jgi:hypothetical protein
MMPLKALLRKRRIKGNFHQNINNGWTPLYISISLPAGGKIYTE